MRRYWRVISPELVKKLQLFARDQKRAKAALAKYAKEIGAIDIGIAESMYQKVVSVAFAFRGLPDKKLWKSKHGQWWQPKATAKEILNRCKEIVDQFPSTEAVTNKIGAKIWIDTESFSMCTPVFVRIKKQWYFSTRDPKFSGSEHVERVADIEIERITKR